MDARIAVTVDGTPGCTAALARAVALAGNDGWLTGVFVLDSGWADFIGNDWQSSRNARQGFLDYVLDGQRRQADAARAQFDAATGGLPKARFAVLVGDPADALVRMMDDDGADALVVGEAVFRECGRPSIATLARTLMRRVRQPVHVI